MKIKIEELLISLNLEIYRALYMHNRSMEADMPKETRAMPMLYKIYWEQRRPASFEEFYKEYLNSVRAQLESLRVKLGYTNSDESLEPGAKATFYAGLEARIFRTWASLMTQIHAGYVAESVFGEGSVTMSPELDYAGIDFQVRYNGRVLNYQVKKESSRKEAVRDNKNKPKNKIDGEYILLEYSVLSKNDLSAKRDGTKRIAVIRFNKQKEVTRYANGFVVFTPHVFEKKKKEIDGATPDERGDNLERSADLGVFF